MSCDWNIRCLDCAITLHFDDANHQDDLMRSLIRHAPAIAALLPLLEESRHGVELKTYYGVVDVKWLAEHAGHRLQAIDEYGRLDDQCHHNWTCVACSSSHKCERGLNHEGDHGPKALNR